jgi:hypothetical protein
LYKENPQIDVIFQFESSKKKPTKFLKIMPHLKVSKTYVFGTKKLKGKKNCNSYGLMKIWSNFNHSKVLNYQIVKVFK